MVTVDYLSIQMVRVKMSVYRVYVDSHVILQVTVTLADNVRKVNVSNHVEKIVTVPLVRSVYRATAGYHVRYASNIKSYS